MKRLLLLSFLFLLAACNNSSQQPQGITGLWRETLTYPGGELPFGIDIAVAELIALI